MPREYQLKGEKRLPHDVYMETLWVIRSYYKSRRRREEIIHSSPHPPDGQPRGYSIGDETANKAIRLSKLEERISAIDQTILNFNAKYGDLIARDDVHGFDSLEAFMDNGYFCYVLFNPATNWPSNRTWKRFRQRFAYQVAEKLNYI